MRFCIACVTFLSLLAPSLAQADWILDPSRSSLSFISIKAKDLAEVHSFKEMSGTITEFGEASVTLMLDSVETLIDVRNQRMRELLFETVSFSQAVVTTKLDAADAMAVGEIRSIAAEGTLYLHGLKQTMTLQMQAARVASDTVMVASVKPVIVNAQQFGLDAGIEKLREIAGLPSISHAVPVSFVLTFTTKP